MLPGLLAPIFDSKIPTPDKVVIGRSPAAAANSEPARQKVIQIRSLQQVADLPAKDRSEYLQQVGNAAKQHMLAKVIDILA
ncbi:MAG: hypothetical protein HQ481_11275 [Alphaproteobacteria bacterium]|nr:hypothetical protein [Alphaproteobacteria bacterium]